MQSNASDRVFLRGIVLFGRHGLFDEEETLGHRFEIDLDFHVDLKAAGEADDVTRTIDYGVAYAIVREVVEGARCKLIETLAEKIAARLFEAFESLVAVTIEIRKPSAPIPGVFDHAGISIHRERPR